MRLVACLERFVVAERLGHAPQLLVAQAALRCELRGLLGVRQHLVDTRHGIAIGPQIDADKGGQLGGVGAQHGLDERSRLALGLVARQRHRRGQRGGRRRLLRPRLQAGLALLAGLLGAALGEEGRTHFVAHLGERTGVRCAVRHDAAGHELVAAGVQRLGVAFLVERVGAEQRVQEALVGQHTRRARGGCAGDVVGRVDLQLQLVGHGLQAVGLFVDGVAEFFGQFAEVLLRLLRAQLLLELRAHGLERRHGGGLDAGQLDDVVAEVAFDHIADVALLGQRVGGLRDHGVDALVALEAAQIAAAGGAGVVLRVLARHVGEAAGRLPQLGQQFGGRRPGLFALGGWCVLGRHDQDVASAALFGRAEGGGVLFVVGAQVLLAHVDGFLDAVEVEHHVFDPGRFRRLVTRRMGLVEGLQLGVRRVQLGGEFGRGEAHHAGFAPLKEGVHGHIRLRLAGKAGFHHAAQHLPRRQVVPHVGLEALGREPLLGQQLAVAVHVQRAVGAAQGADGRVLLQFGGQARVGGDQVAVVGRGDQHAIAHQTLQRGVLERRRIQQAAVQRRVAGAQAIGFHAVRVVPLHLRDGVAVHRGDLARAFVEARVITHTEQHEGRDDQKEQHPHDELGVPADEFEHARDSSCSRSRNEKGEPGFAFAVIGRDLVGADGVEPPTYAL